ncbi:hypothetical protein REC12_11725 [Desulfosporosinus sp. PR]|uniref:hypothetical protein n=1 Tax=Candidatus Desulfosporosinus nitrosoreducens TaxID=3401928 RepID=UPI0027F0A867|nr:hypothetical protein [Desulfosporosinus sp. PR]MDQ7094259.1 hypothetical protein [Desulfosporosinus sp. PR]
MPDIFLNTDLTKPIDTVELLSAGVQVFFPLTTYLQVGILFVPQIGCIKVYIQQEALTEDILIEFKVFEFRVPVTLFLLLLNLGIAHFYSNCFLALLKKLTSKIQGNI